MLQYLGVDTSPQGFCAKALTWLPQRSQNPGVDAEYRSPLTKSMTAHVRQLRAPAKGPVKRPSAASRQMVAEGFAKPREAAAYLGVSLKWIYHLVRANGISHIRLGKRIVIPWGALHEYAATCLKRGSIV